MEKVEIFDHSRFLPSLMKSTELEVTPCSTDQPKSMSESSFSVGCRFMVVVVPS